MAMVLNKRGWRVCPMCCHEQEDPCSVFVAAPRQDQVLEYQEKPWLQETWVTAKCRRDHCGFTSSLRVDLWAFMQTNWEKEREKAIAVTKRRLGEIWKPYKDPEKDLPLTSALIEVSLARYFDYRRNYIVPNVHWGLNLHECDILVVTKAGYATEVEIKVSVADMRADFDKPHGHRSNRIKQLYYCVPQPLQEKILPLVPEHAGLLVVNPRSCQITCVKPAVTKQSLAFKEYEIRKLLELGTLRIWDLKEGLHHKQVRESPESILWFDEDGVCPRPPVVEDDDPELGAGRPLLREEEDQR